MKSKQELFNHNPFLMEVSWTNLYLKKFIQNLSKMEPSDESLRVVACCPFIHKQLSPQKNTKLGETGPDGNSRFNKIIYALVQECDEGTAVRGDNYLEAFSNYMTSGTTMKLSDLQGKLIQKPIKEGTSKFCFTIFTG